jgi:hypothetical protein
MPTPVYIGYTKGDIIIVDIARDGSNVASRLWTVRCLRCSGTPYTMTERALRYTDAQACQSCNNREQARRVTQASLDNLARKRQLFYSLHIDCSYSIASIAHWARLPSSVVSAAINDEHKYRNRG